MRVTLDFPAAEEILQEVGLNEQGDAQSSRADGFCFSMMERS